MNKEIKDWVNELKRLHAIDKEHKKNLIDFNNYFKYSGKIEEDKKEEEFETNKMKPKKVITNDDVVKFYFENFNYTIKEVAKVFGIGDAAVRARLDKYFRNRKKIKNGENIEND